MVTKGHLTALKLSPGLLLLQKKPPHVVRSVRWQSCHVLPKRLSALRLYLLQAELQPTEQRELC